MSIQIDNGDFTRIHNAILEGMAKARFTALELRCLLFLVRKTYGWQKKEDAISLLQWTEGLGIEDHNRGNVSTVLSGLVRQGVIYMQSNGNNRPATWGLVKDYFDNETVMQPHNSSADEIEPTVMQPHNHKRKDIKERTTKKVKEKTRARSRSGVAHPNTQPIMAAYVDALGYAPGNYGMETKAAKELAKAGYEPPDVVAAYLLLKQDPFWKIKHLSLQTLVKEMPAMRHALLNGISLARAPTNGYLTKGERQEAEIEKGLALLRGNQGT